MKLRQWHRAIGILLVLPFITWALTGFVFFLKPGYGGAYASLAVPVYPFETEIRYSPKPIWREMRLLRTVLGDHLLVRTDQGREHLDPVSLQPLPEPGEAGFRRLLSDAIKTDPHRYGSILRVEGQQAVTDTGVEIALNWKRLSLYQRGKDTDWIDRLYRMHYLQWTGVKSVDRVLGFVGLLAVLFMALTGTRLFFSKTKR